MERMSKKFKVPEVETVTKSTISNLSKWIPLLCAGAAAGVSIIALKEIKNVRKELMTLKKDQVKGPDTELIKRMKNMEDQLKILTDFIKSSSIKETVTKESEVIKNVVKENDVVKIINNDEYEEVEVTDDEADQDE